MNHLLSTVKSIDLFAQTQQFRVSRKEKAKTSICGALCTVLIYAVTLSYMVVQAEKLINHGLSNINVVLHE